MSTKLSIKRIALYLLWGLMTFIGISIDIDIICWYDLQEAGLVFRIILISNVICGLILMLFTLTAIDSVRKNLKTNIIVLSVFIYTVTMFCSILLSAFSHFS